MKITELIHNGLYMIKYSMIGYDIVKYDIISNEFTIVMGIGHTYRLDNAETNKNDEVCASNNIDTFFVEPIPLTDEWLNVLNFSKSTFDSNINYYERPDFLIHESLIDNVGHNNFSYRYVHEVQKAFNLCEIDNKVSNITKKAYYSIKNK